MNKELAQITNPALGKLSTTSNTAGVTFFGELIPSLIGLAFVAGIILFMFMIIISGIQWVTSGGDKAAVEAAKGRLTQALIGISVLFLTFAIIRLIEHFFGVSILTLDISSLIIK